VHIISATREHAEETVEKISKNVPDASSKIHHHAIDLGNLQSIVDLLPKLQSLPRIDQLYLIAGVGVAPFGLTKDGLGNHFAVNHLSHFLLVDGLLPKLKETSESKQSGSEEERFSTRIITESSELHRTARAEIKCDSVEEFNQEDDANRLYARSKLLG
jgi:NAD(P)-dependent dehydrogenase (short-subunit alcohol dehydrogenase family)